MKIINGRKIAKTLLAQVHEQIGRMSLTPGLAIVLVGDDPASHLYVRIKERACRQVGMKFEKKVFPATADENEILRTIQQLNTRADIHGIVVQLPLPEQLNENAIISAISPQKDVDGYHPKTIQRLVAGQQTFIPALARSILLLIESTGVPLGGKTAAVIANSNEFYQPLEYLIRQRGGRSVFCDPTNFRKECRSADIVIVAVGQPGIITADDIKPNTIVIDVGITRQPGGVVGDVDAATLKNAPGFLTPVPGGVGPVTVASLLANTVQAAE